MARQTLAGKTIGGKYAGPVHRAAASGNCDWTDLYGELPDTALHSRIVAPGRWELRFGGSTAKQPDTALR